MDVVVVGGGLAGLAAATLAARDGARVTLLERGREIGGRARSQEKSGFTFNLGPHALYRHGVAVEVLRDLGVPIEGRVPAPEGLALRGGRRYRLPATPWAIMTTKLFGGRTRLEAARFLMTWRSAEGDGYGHTSAAEWLEATVQDPALHAYARTLVRLFCYTDDLEHLSADAAIAQGRQGINGNVWYLHDGWQTLVNALVAAARDAGVRIEVGARVEGVVGDGTVRGVRLADGGEIAAGAVILAVAPEVAARLAGDEIAARGSWLEGRRPALATTLDLALERLPDPDVRLALGIDAPHYYSVHSATARLAPAGGALVHLLRYRRADEANPDPAELERLADRLQPGWREHVIERRALPRLVVMNALPLAARGGLAGRPPVTVEGTAGLFLAGDWVGDHGLLADAALASARQAARRATAHRAATVREAA